MTYILPGEPIALQRARFGGGRVYDKQKQLKHGLQLILLHQHQNYPLFSGPLELDCVFFFSWPKATSKKIRLGAAPPDFVHPPHFCRPDLDNCIKMICDLCNEIIFKDDAQIASIIAKKMYCNDGEQRTEFTIRPLM